MTCTKPLNNELGLGQHEFYCVRDSGVQLEMIYVHGFECPFVPRSKLGERYNRWETLRVVARFDDAVGDLCAARSLRMSVGEKSKTDPRISRSAYDSDHLIDARRSCSVHPFSTTTTKASL